MKVVSFNANGIRSAIKKGFFEWVYAEDPDVICIQETKAQLVELGAGVVPNGYHYVFDDAVKKGYSGVAIFSKKPADRVVIGLGAGFEDMDDEGRYVEAQFGDISIASLYLPSGSSGDARQAVKFSCLDRLLPRLAEIQASGRSLIICGDWNIAHQNIDLKNWKGNQKNSGFLPEERAWLDQLFASGWVDAFRVVEPAPEQYTWWSNRGRARENNVGWRIDYHIVTANWLERIQSAFIYREQLFSDHAPLVLTYRATV